MNQETAVTYLLKALCDCACEDDFCAIIDNALSMEKKQIYDARTDGVKEVYLPLYQQRKSNEEYYEELKKLTYQETEKIVQCLNK